MVSIIACMLLTTAMIIAFKLFDRWHINSFVTIVINYGVAASIGFMGSNLTLQDIRLSNVENPLMTLSIGISFITAFTIFGISTKKAGMAITTIAGKMSVIIPVLFCTFYFNIDTSWLKYSGIALALCAFYLTLKKEKGNNLSFMAYVLPILVFIGNGAVDTISNTYQLLYHSSGEKLSLMLTIVFLTALALGTVSVIVLQLMGKLKGLRWGVHLMLGVVIGILNFYASYFFMKGMSEVQASVFLPTLNTGIVAFSTLIGFFIFKEHLSKLNWIGIALSVLAILLISVG